MDLLKNITYALVESEDDLFPGLDTSAFEEHNTYKSTKLPPTKQFVRAEGQKDRLVALQKVNQKTANQIRHRLRANDCHIWKNSAGPNDIAYTRISGIEQAVPHAFEH